MLSRRPTTPVAARLGLASRGTVLLLFPTAMLIMFALGAVVIDVSLAHVRGSQLESAAASAANDALAALDVEALRAGEGLRLDPDRVRSVVTTAVAAGPLPDARVVAVATERDDVDRIVVVVTLELDVDLVMAPAVGDLASVTLRRTARATILGSTPP